MSDQFRARWDKLHRSDNAKKEDYAHGWTPRSSSLDYTVSIDLDFKRDKPAAFAKCLKNKTEVLLEIKTFRFALPFRDGKIYTIVAGDTFESFMTRNTVNRQKASAAKLFRFFNRAGQKLTDAFLTYVRELPVYRFSNTEDFHEAIFEYDSDFSNIKVLCFTRGL